MDRVFYVICQKAGPAMYNDFGQSAAPESNDGSTTCSGLHGDQGTGLLDLAGDEQGTRLLQQFPLPVEGRRGNERGSRHPSQPWLHFVFEVLLMIREGIYMAG